MINSVATRFYTEVLNIPEDASQAAYKTFTKDSMVAFYRTNDRGGLIFVVLGGTNHILLRQESGGQTPEKTGLTFSYIPSGTVLRVSDTASGGAWQGVMVTIELE
jgi:hypothetical protein